MGRKFPPTSRGMVRVLPPDKEEGDRALPSSTGFEIVWDLIRDPSSSHILLSLFGKERYSNKSPGDTIMEDHMGGA